MRSGPGEVAARDGALFSSTGVVADADGSGDAKYIFTFDGGRGDMTSLVPANFRFIVRKWIG